MKKKSLLLILLFTSTLIFAQQNDAEYPQDVDKKHEIKLSASNLISFSWFDASYEYLINKESSFGTSVILSLSNDDDRDLDFYKNFSLTSYYRRFLSEKYARGFFIEGYAMFATYDESFYGYYDQNGNYVNGGNGNGVDFSVGFSIGSKFVTKDGFTVEFYLGIGRNLAQKHNRDILPRGGVSLGYRF